MALATQTTNLSEAKLFRRLILTNSRYWLTLAEADVDRLMGETPQVLKALEYALELLEAWATARELLRRLSPLMIRQGHGLAWERFLSRGITRSREEQDPAEIDLRLELGNFYRLQGRLVEAETCLQKGLALCEQYGQTGQELTLLNYLGLVARLSGQHEQALAYSQRVLAAPNLSARERAEAFNVMGLVAHDYRQWEEAFDYFKQALILYHSLGDNYQIARILTNQGVVLQRSSRLDEAEINYQEAIRYFQASGDQTEYFKAIMNLGNVHLTKSAYNLAIKQYEQILPIFKKFNYLVDLAHINNNLGMAYAGLSEWQTAEAYFLISIEIWESLADNYNLANVLDNLGAMFINANQPEQANDILHQALKVLSTDLDNQANRSLQQVIKDRLMQLNTKQ